MELSVVIPVYNVQGYLGRCLDSVFRQECSRHVLEVIAVDDGSTDASLEVLRGYEEAYPGLTVIEHGRNRTLSAARTTGISAAKGRYILNVDSDDWLLSGSLNALLSVIRRDRADVVMFNHVRSDGAGVDRLAKTVHVEAVVPADQRVFRDFYTSCWNKAVRRELVTDMVYHDFQLNHSEDFIFGVEIFLKATTVSLLPKVCYAYFRNPGSLSRTVSARELVEIKSEVLRALKALKDRYAGEESYIEQAFLHQVSLIHKRLALHRLGESAEIEWGSLLDLVDELGGGTELSDEIRGSANSAAGCVRNLHKYWGARSALAYVVNGLLLPRIGRGWNRKA